jgi:hypothetical protein
MRDEQETRLAALLLAQALVVERRDDGLAGAGRGDDQVARAAVAAFGGEAVEHRLLVGLRLQVEPGGGGNGFGVRALGLLQRAAQLQAMRVVVRIEALEFRIVPERLEMCFGGGEEVRLPGLCELDRPFDATEQRGRGEVRAADEGGAEAGRTVKQPGLRVQAAAAAVEGDTQFHAWQGREPLDGPGFGRAGIGGRDDA